MSAQQWRQRWASSWRLLKRQNDSGWRDFERNIMRVIAHRYAETRGWWPLSATPPKGSR